MFFVVLVLFILPLVILNQQQIQQLLSRAAYKPANIVIEAKNIGGPINTSWAAFSQGGEEAPPVLAPVVGRMKELAPKLIRIDHIYDFNNVVQKSGDNFIYNFSTLDKVVDDIIAMGAVPFLSLSYMPPVFTLSGSVIDAPADWNNWKNLVKATIEHFSGKNKRNLSDVYYEVWNEPELPQFGGWKLGGEKDYRLLYFYAAAGAGETNDVNNFYLGGPAVGSYYPEWITNLVSYFSQNNLRFDFYSWHRYTKKPYEYISDARKIRNLLSFYPAYSNLPLILSEWGIDSQNSEINNSNTTAAYVVDAVSRFNRDIKYAFNFEVKDGPSTGGGKWGLFTHETNPNNPLSAKPKFKAFAQLAKIIGNQILLTGDGTYVTGLAAKTSSKIFVILSNYDSTGRNLENVPITFVGLDPAMYSLKYNYALDDRSGVYEIPSTNGSISKNFLLPANSIIFLELTRLSNLATFIPGPSAQSNDNALIINNIDGPLTFGFPEFNLLPSGSISFDIKPFWGKEDNQSFYIWEAPFSIKEEVLDKMSVSKQKTAQGNVLTLSVSQKQENNVLSLSANTWEKDSWHHIEIGWNQDQFWLSADGQKVQKQAVLDIRNGKNLTFSPINAAVDNIKIVMGKDEIIQRYFNGRIDK